MKSDYPTKIFSRYYFIIITIVLVLGTASSIFTFNHVSKNTKEALLKNVASIGSIFDTSDIASFSGSENDLKNPAYVALKDKLEKIPEIDSGVRFVYLWGYRDGNVYFFVDSEPSTSSDYSPPGQVYNEASEVDRNMFLKNLPPTIEMGTDRWGTWLSALTPIRDKDTGALIAVMGMDMSASNYFRTVYVYTAIPVITTIFVLILIIIGLVLRRREQEYLALRSDLVSIASHEIRSPLTGITWIMNSLLKSSENMSEKQKHDVAMVENKSKELLMTINDLLESAVVEKTSKRKLVKEPLDMKALFTEMTENFSLVLAEKNVQLNIDASITPEVVVKGDSDKIKRMFNNLLANAIKYSKDGGNVSVGKIDKGTKFIFWIKDTGIGIPLKDQSKIFKGFFRAENAKNITSNGTGLGLHYVKQVVDLHDGRIWYESKEDVGSTFYVELPK